MSAARILIQLDPDAHASAFDAVVAIDSGVDHLLRYGGVRPDDVASLIHGAIFTRAPSDLHSTAVFVGGSDVTAAERLAESAIAAFVGPMRVSMLLDPNGANTTAAAAVLVAARHVALAETTALVLGGTGPVGGRLVRLLARNGARVRVGSRTRRRAEAVCETVGRRVENARLSAWQTSTPEETAAALSGAQVAISAGAAGVELLPADAWAGRPELQVAIDLNAVPPAGIAGVSATDKAVRRDGVVCYGALGVGGTKMRIHKAAIAALFADNQRVLDAEEIYALGCELESSGI